MSSKNTCMWCAHCEFDEKGYAVKCKKGLWILEDFNDKGNYSKILEAFCDDFKKENGE